MRPTFISTSAKIPDIVKEVNEHTIEKLRDAHKAFVQLGGTADRRQYFTKESWTRVIAKLRKTDREVSAQWTDDEWFSAVIAGIRGDVTREGSSGGETVHLVTSQFSSMVIPRFKLSSWQKDTDHFVASIQNVMRIVTQQRSSTKFVKADYVAIVKNVHDHLTCQDASVMECCQLSVVGSLMQQR